MIHISGYTGQGCTSVTADVVVFMDDGPRTLLRLPMGFHYGNEDINAEITDASVHDADFAVRYVRGDASAQEEATTVAFTLGAGPAFTRKVLVPDWASRSC